MSADAERLAALWHYDLLDTPTEDCFDRIARIVARLLDTPLAAVALLDAQRLWFKAAVGYDRYLPPGAREVDLTSFTFCNAALHHVTPFVVTDTLDDPETAAIAAANIIPGIRFFASAPLRNSDGHTIGMVCTLDFVPRTPSEGQISSLTDLAALAMHLVEQRRQASSSKQRADILRREIDHRVRNSLQFVASLLNLQGRARGASAAVREQLGLAADRVNAVALVHEHLHREGVDEAIDGFAYLQGLCSKLEVSTQTKLHVRGTEPIVLDNKQVQSVGLIVNELVTNASKYGGDNVTIEIGRAEPDRCRIAVTDDGKPLGDDFNPFAATSGLGMLVVRTLTKQLGGEINAGPNPTGGGAAFVLTFPHTPAVGAPPAASADGD